MANARPRRRVRGAPAPGGGEGRGERIGRATREGRPSNGGPDSEPRAGDEAKGEGGGARRGPAGSEGAVRIGPPPPPSSAPSPSANEARREEARRGDVGGADEGPPSYEDLLRRIMDIRCSIRLLGRDFGDVRGDGPAREPAPAGDRDSIPGREGIPRPSASGVGTGGSGGRPPSSPPAPAVGRREGEAPGGPSLEGEATDVWKCVAAAARGRREPSEAVEGDGDGGGGRPPRSDASDAAAPESDPRPSGSEPSSSPERPVVASLLRLKLSPKNDAGGGRASPEAFVDDGCEPESPLIPARGGTAPATSDSPSSNPPASKRGNAKKGGGRASSEVAAQPSGSESSSLESPIVASEGGQASSEVFVDDGCEPESPLPPLCSGTDPATSDSPSSNPPASRRGKAKKRGGRGSSEVAALPSGSESSPLESPIVASEGGQASSEVFVDDGCEPEPPSPPALGGAKPATPDTPLSNRPAPRRRRGAKKRGGRGSSEAAAAASYAEKYIGRRSRRGSKIKSRHGGGRNRGVQGKKWQRHRFSLGQPAGPGDADVPADAGDARARVAGLREGEGAWVRRRRRRGSLRRVRGGDGDEERGDPVWTYAILRKRGRAGMELVVDERGTTKALPPRAWAGHVRAVARDGGGGDGATAPAPAPGGRPPQAGGDGDKDEDKDEDEDEDKDEDEDGGSPREVDGGSPSDVNAASPPPECAPAGTSAETDGPSDGVRVKTKRRVRGSRPSAASLRAAPDGGGGSRPKEHHERLTPDGPARPPPEPLPPMPPTSVSNRPEEETGEPCDDSEISNSVLTVKRSNRFFFDRMATILSAGGKIDRTTS